MKKVHVKELKGGECLAKDIYTSNYNIIMTKGITLKKEYLDKLLMLGIESVYIDIEEETRDTVLIEKIQEECLEQVRRILEQHIYKHNNELTKLCTLAECLISEMLKEEEVEEKLVEIREEGGDLYSHSINVCGLATMLALKMGLDKDCVCDIAKGSLLHDIGLRYITVPYENVDISALSLQEKNEYKRHALEGYKSLEEEGWISSRAKEIILFHHENEAGTGYPLKTTGNKLSVPVKIVIVCNVFDEMVSGIGYKRTHLREAIEYLRDNKKRLFDKDVTEKFLQMIVQYPVGCIVETNQGEIGKVIAQNKEMLDRPILEIFKNSNGQKLDEPKKLDLIKVLNVFISRTIDIC